MIKKFTLDYWLDGGWYVGKLREVPGIFSQAETLEELKLNICDAYELTMQEASVLPVDKFHTIELLMDTA